MKKFLAKLAQLLVKYGPSVAEAVIAAKSNKDAK